MSLQSDSYPRLSRKVRRSAVFAVGVAITISLVLFQNCGQFKAMLPSSLLRTQVYASWSDATFLRAIPSSGAENVSTSTVSLARPVFDSVAGRVTYPSFFADGSWQLTNIAIDGSGIRNVILASAQFPNFSFGGFDVIRESGLAIVLLTAKNSAVKNRLFSIRTDGTGINPIAENVLSAQISQDGARVNFTAKVVSGNSTSYRIYTTLIAAAAPVEIGAIDSSTYIAYAGDPVSRSHSTASNVPTFYLVSAAVTGGYTATLFNLGGPSVFPSPWKLQSDFTGVGDFNRFGFSASGKMVMSLAGAGRVASTWLDTTGTIRMQAAVMSPDAKLVASSDATGAATVYREDGTSISVPSVKNMTVGPWSDDSRYVLYYSNVNSWARIDTSDGTVLRTTRNIAITYQEVPSAFIGDGAYLLIRGKNDTTAKLELVSIDGSRSIMLTNGTDRTATTGPGTYVDTGDAVIFNDDWGLYSVRYDGSDRKRLDPPNNEEFATSYAATTFGNLWWDAARTRLIYQPAVSPRSTTAFGSGLHRFASLVPGSPPTYLTTEIRPVRQIGGFNWNYQVYEDVNAVAFNSVDATDTIQIYPGILSVASLSGGGSTRVSPNQERAAPYGLGTGYFPPVLSKIGDKIATFFNFHVALQMTVQQTDGTTLTDLGQYDLHMISPDKKWLFMTGASKGYLKAADSFSSDAAILISNTLMPAGRSSCFGCGDGGWTYTDSSGSFTGNSKLILNASRDNGGTYSSYFIDPLNVGAPPLDLGFSTFLIMPDGLTIIGSLTDNTLVQVSALDPSNRTTLFKGKIKAAAGRNLLFTDVELATFSAYNLDTKTQSNLIPTTLPAGVISDGLQVSKDGLTILYRYRAKNLTAPYACSNYYGIVMALGGTLKTVIESGDDCQAVNSLKLNPLGDTISYLSGGRIVTAENINGWVAVNASPADETVRSFSFSDDGQKMFSISSNAQAQLVASVASRTGTSRLALAPPLPSSKIVKDVRFIRGGKSILMLTDAETDGEIVLARFDLE